jgi:23S rRNA (uracil1939-C5)-methyltransferase
VSTPRGDRRSRRRSAPLPRRETVEITSIAAGGEGVGRLTDGRVVFVHRTAPGELVTTALTAERPRWVRGRLVAVLRPSPARRDAPCPHYRECGGCTLEHLAYPAQLRAKSRIVADAMTRIAGLARDAPEVVPSPREYFYRNRVSFTLRRAGRGQLQAGFHALHEPDRIVPVDGRCRLPEVPIGEVWDRLRAGWGPDAVRLPAGERLRLTLRATSARAVSLLVEGGDSPGEPQELLEGVPGLAAIWWKPGSAAARHLAGAPGLPETWGDETFVIGGGAFLQVNRSAAELLERFVLEIARPLHGLRVVDAYCGVGMHARRFSRAGARVVGIELDADAVATAAASAGDKDTFLHGRVEDLLPEVLPADLVVLNPPRAGLDPRAVDALLRMPPPRIIYVSCDPATLARDLKRLGERFEVAELRGFDLFPQTAHVETVVSLELRHPGNG